MVYCKDCKHHPHNKSRFSFIRLFVKTPMSTVMASCGIEEIEEVDLLPQSYSPDVQKKTRKIRRLCVLKNVWNNCKDFEKAKEPII